MIWFVVALLPLSAFARAFGRFNDNLISFVLTHLFVRSFVLDCSLLFPALGGVFHENCLSDDPKNGITDVVAIGHGARSGVGEQYYYGLIEEVSDFLFNFRFFFFLVANANIPTKLGLGMGSLLSKSSFNTFNESHSCYSSFNQSQYDSQHSRWVPLPMFDGVVNKMGSNVMLRMDTTKISCFLVQLKGKPCETVYDQITTAFSQTAKMQIPVDKTFACR